MLTYPCSCSHTHSHTHTHTRALTDAHTLLLTHIHACSCSHSHTHTHTSMLTLTYSHSHTQSHSHISSLPPLRAEPRPRRRRLLRAIASLHVPLQWPHLSVHTPSPVLFPPHTHNTHIIIKYNKIQHGPVGQWTMGNARHL